MIELICMLGFIALVLSLNDIWKQLVRIANVMEKLNE